MSSARWRSRSMTPSGPSTTTSERSTSAVLLVGAGADQQPDHAAAPQVADRLEGLDVAEVVADEHHRVGVELPLRGCVRRCPCPCRGPGPPRPSGRARVTRPCAAAARSSTGVSRCCASAGSSRRRVCTATARPFSSMCASPRPSRRSSSGSSEIREARPRGGRGERTRRSRADQRSLPYCPSTRSPARARRSDAPTSSRSPSATAWRTGRPVTTAIAAHLLGQRDEHLGGVGVDVRLRRGPRRSGPASRRSPGRRRPGPRRRPARRTGGAPGRCGTPWPQPTRPAGWRQVPDGTRSGEVGGEDHRQPVHRHRVDGRQRPARCRGPCRAAWRRPRAARRVVDRRRRDRAVPVVGADDLPAGGADARRRCRRRAR